MRFWLRVLTGLGSVLCATALVLVETDVLDVNAVIIVILAVVTGAAACGNALQSVIVDKHMERLFLISDECQDAFAAALGVIVRSTGERVTYENLGFNCWVVPAWYRHAIPFGWRRRAEGHLPPAFYKWLCSRRPALRRVKAFRLTSGSGSSNIRWTHGKGALGMCWATPGKDVIVVPCYDWYRTYVDVSGVKRTIKISSESYYDNVTKKIRAGLSYEEFCAIAGRYGAVLVAPMKDLRGDFVGCVTVDLPWGDFSSELDQSECRDALVSAANWIVQAIERIDGRPLR